MKKILALVLFAACATLSAQSNIYSAGMCHTSAAPTFNPGARGCRVALDTTTQTFYLWKTGTTWQAIGQEIDEVLTCAAPSYTPTKWQSLICINRCATPEIYYYYSGSWHIIGGGGGGGGAINTDATLDGDGSGGDLLRIAQQSATTSKVLSWTGATWEPSWGNPTVFVTTGQTITTAVNEVLIGTIGAGITLGLPTCDATTDMKHFKFVRNGTDAFSVTIDPSGSQTFYDGTSVKTSYGKLSIDCTCRFSGGTGVWFFDNF